MINRKFLLPILGVISLVLSACAQGPSLVAAGKLTTTAPYSLSVERDWSDVSVLFYNRAKAVRILSIDGHLLNRLYISDGLTAADPLMVNALRGDQKNSPAPRGKADMSLSEQIEFVTTSLSVLDYQKITASNPRPVTIGTAKGVRFEFSAKTSQGLNMKGLAQAVSYGGKSYYIVYIAPSEYYFDAHLKNVVATMDSASLQ